MFGSKKVQELEAQLNDLQQRLNQAMSEKEDLSRQLQGANSRIADLEAQLQDFDLERLKKETSATKAEYEGLRDLYRQKNQDFDDAKDEKEQSFARDQAIQRHNLENEIRDNRQANQDYVTQTVKTFGESYNYYLGQIKLLMDALGKVATQTGEALFAGENADLKERFGSQMRHTLRSGVEALGPGASDLFVIEPEEAPEEAIEDVGETFEDAAEDVGEFAEEAAEEVEEVVEDAEDALEDAVEEAGDVIEDAGDAPDDVVEEIKDFAEAPESEEPPAPIFE